MIDLYTAPTPNGHKASCTLEALEIPYETQFVNISEGDQHEAGFRAINPNVRIPAIVDREMDDFAIFESGAIMIYLAEKIPPAIDRYQNECRRLFAVLDGHLANSEWLADDYSIADIANWCWARTYKWSGVSIEGLEHLQRWLQVMREQPGMAAGIEVPFSLGNLLEDEKEAADFAKNAQKTLQT